MSIFKKKPESVDKTIAQVPAEKKSRLKKLKLRLDAKTEALLDGRLRILKKPYVQTGILSFLVVLYIEGFGYGNVTGGFEFFAVNPFAFICNMAIIYAMLSIAWIFRRRIFVYTLVCVLWMTLGTINGIILMYRMTPFTTADLQIIDMGLDILPSYLDQTQLTMVVAGLITIVLVLVLVFFFAPKMKDRPAFKKTGITVLIAIAVAAGTLQLGVKTKALDVYFENLWDAYTRCGMPYCFLNTWLNKGIDKPFGYSQTMVEDIMGETLPMEGYYESKPNIIFLQMESFVDPDELTKFSYSDVATPFFKEMKEEYSSGYLRVPVIGGGTANTEFEVMSGMSLRFFGPGEYPYKSVLMERPCETMGYDLKAIGYATHAIHNHRGAFYNRNIVFANLGFDDFTSLEYMNYVSRTPKGYARDDVLQGEILGAMEATEMPDYIYCISVQGHGEYPKTQLVADPPITVTDAGATTEEKNAYEYYITQVAEMDDFLRRLTEELSSFEEDVVLVVYGDHLPALGMTDEETVSGSTFDTQYVIWTNFELEKQDKDLTAYQLSAEVQSRIGMREGTLFAFHQQNMDSETYMNDLSVLQYDMLYGNGYVYGDSERPETVDMTMGFRPIRVIEVKEVAGEYYLVGEGFTPFSKVSLHDKILDTVYLSPTLLKLDRMIDPSEAVSMKVSQVEKYDVILSTTE